MSTETLNHLLGLGTIAIQIATVFLLLILAFSSKQNRVRSIITEHSFILGFIVVLSAIVGSLIYSDVIGYEPCVLCWYVRIVMYPQALIFAIAQLKNDSLAWVYARSLTVIGLAISIYQYYGQMFNTGVLPCSTSAVSCAKLYFVEFGYITIPMMALSIFAFLFTLSFFKK